jgi:hypothetical protein
MWNNDFNANEIREFSSSYSMEFLLSVYVYGPGGVATGSGSKIISSSAIFHFGLPNA